MNGAKTNTEIKNKFNFILTDTICEIEKKLTFQRFMLFLW